MKRRRRNEPSADVELIDVDPGPTVAVETIAVRSTNRFATVAAVGVAIVAAVLVIGVGNATDEATGSAVTIDDSDADTARPTPQRRDAEPPTGVMLGDGPGLVWQSVDIDAVPPSWWGSQDGFVTYDDTTEWRISLDGSNPVVSVGPSPLADRPGYQVFPLEGGRLFVPTTPTPDHLLVARGDDEPMRVTLPVVMDPPESDMFETFAWVYGQLIGDRLVAHIGVQTSLNVAEIEARTGRDLSNVAFASVSFGQIDLYPSNPGALPDPIPLEEARFTEAEIAIAETLDDYTTQLLTIDLMTGQAEPVELPDFDNLENLVLHPDGSLLVSWIDTSGASLSSATLDGVTWSAPRRTMHRWPVSSGTQLFDMSTSSSISRSTDGGETWEATRTPLREVEQTFAGDVIVQGRSWDPFRSGRGNDGGIVVDTGSDDYRLTLFPNNDTFELRGIHPFDTPLLAGSVGNPASGAEWDWVDRALVFTDPDSGEELLRVPEGAVRVADAKANPMEYVAFARWPAGVDDPEWLMTSPQEVFGADALSVEFFAGGTQLLAVVITTDGYDFFITDTELP